MGCFSPHLLQRPRRPDTYQQQWSGFPENRGAGPYQQTNPYQPWDAHIPPIMTPFPQGIQQPIVPLPPSLPTHSSAASFLPSSFQPTMGNSSFLQSLTSYPPSQTTTPFSTSHPTTTPLSFPPSLPSTLSTATGSVYEPVSDTAEDSEEEEGQWDPFQAIPALQGFNLSGARVALSKRRAGRVPAAQTRSLWLHARDLANTTDSWRPVKATRVTASYTCHDEAACFVAQSRPPMFPLEEAACRRDGALSNQQTRLGAAAHAVCLAMTQANSLNEKLQAALPSTSEGRGPTEEIQKLLQEDIPMALGHALRILAAESTSICKDRRQLCLQTVRDSQCRAQVEKLPPSETKLFNGDLEAVIAAIKNRREVQGAFKPTHRRTFKVHRQDRDRQGQDRQQRDRGDRNPNSTHQPHKRPFRPQPYGANSRGGRQPFKAQAPKTQKSAHGKKDF